MLTKRGQPQSRGAGADGKIFSRMCDLVRGCSARTPDLLQLLYSRWPWDRRERHDFQFLECGMLKKPAVSDPDR